MKKRNWRDVALGMVLAGLIGTMAVPALAATVTKQITAQYNNIQLVVDGVKVTPKDAAGKAVEPFVYEGTTYLPVRAIGEAMGKPVSWDGTTQTVYIGQKPGQANYLVDVCPPYETDDCNIYKSAEGKFFTMAGKKYTNGLVLTYNNAFALMNTNGQYNSMTFTVGHVDGSAMRNRNVEIYLDGVFSQALELTADAAPSEMTIPLNGALNVKITTTSNGATANYGFADIVLS